MELRATVATVTALPLNSSLMATLPVVTGAPPEVTAMVRGCEHEPAGKVPAVSVVAVAIGAGAASAGIASAIINPATKSSRRPRRFMPLTCTFRISKKWYAARLRSLEPIVSGLSLIHISVMVLER